VFLFFPGNSNLFIPSLSDLAGLVSLQRVKDCHRAQHSRLIDLLITLEVAVGIAAVDPVQKLSRHEGVVGPCLGLCHAGWVEVGIAYCCDVAAVFADQIASRWALRRLFDVVDVVHALEGVDKNGTGAVFVVPEEETTAGKLHFAFPLAGAAVSVLAAV